MNPDDYVCMKDKDGKIGPIKKNSDGTVTKGDEILYPYRGEYKTLADIASELNLSEDNDRELKHFIELGFNINEALSML